MQQHFPSNVQPIVGCSSALLNRPLTSEPITVTYPYIAPPVVFQHNLRVGLHTCSISHQHGRPQMLESLFLYRLLGGFTEDPPPVAWLPVEVVRPVNKYECSSVS
jgi:hypothetical protein